MLRYEEHVITSSGNDDPLVRVYTFDRGVAATAALATLDAAGVPIAGYRCQHEHDCCGHYYPSKAKTTVDPDGRTIVQQSWYQNI